LRRSVWTTLILGAVIGGLNLAHHYATAGLGGVGAPFGLYPGGFPVALFLGFSDSLGLSGDTLGPDLRAMMVLGVGIILGAMVSARQSGDLTLAKIGARALSRSKLLRAAAGGILMGAGTWMAQGCLVKHALSGAPALMLSSIVTLAGIVAGIALSAWADERWG